MRLIHSLSRMHSIKCERISTQAVSWLGLEGDSMVSSGLSYPELNYEGTSAAGLYRGLDFRNRSRLPACPLQCIFSANISNQNALDFNSDHRKVYSLCETVIREDEKEKWGSCCFEVTDGGVLRKIGIFTENLQQGRVVRAIERRRTNQQ